MTSELVIVFLYDCDLCKSEEDDPQDAIVYFYPTWVSSEQRHALCSQLMGVTQFFTNAFSIPSVIALQSGKFAVCKTGRFALVVGTDRSILDSLLRRRLTYLCDIIRIFHYSIECIESSLDEDEENLTDKFSQLLQTYLPIVLDGANPFDNLPLFKFPQNRTSVVDDAKIFLESVQKSYDVLGGAVLYQNKVVHSQLIHSLMKLIILAHPYQVKIPDSNVPTSFHLPSGVQLLKIYLKNEEAEALNNNQRINESIVSEKKVDSVQPKNIAVGERCDNELCEIGSPLTKENSLQNRSGKTTTDDEGSSSDGFGTGKDGVPDLVLDAVRARQLVRMSKISKKSNVMNEVSGRMPTSKTADDIHAINNIPMRYFSIGLPKIKASWTDRKRPAGQDSKKLWFNTICDPKYPLYKSNGLPASYSLFSQSNVGPSLVPNGTGKTKKNYRDLSNERPAKRESRQLSLSLSKYSERPPPKDAPLTPLMAKMALCIVADEISESFIADEVTESVDNPFSVVENGSSSEPSSLLLGLSVAKEAPEKSVDSSSMASQHSMFVYGRNSTYVVLVLKKSAEISSNLVDSLWETADEYLKKVDDELDKVVEETSSSWCSGAEVSSAGEYSYAVVDGDWGPVERGGFYRPHQIQMVTCLHETLLSLPQVVDILVREEDSVTYGYRCDSSQVFYQQHCSQNLGVPTPADLMGVIPWKAKSVIQRDHHLTAA